MELAARFRDELGLRRAVETGTWHGDTARALLNIFPEVVSIELSDRLYLLAQKKFNNVPGIHLLHGHSVRHLSNLGAQQIPTLYFLDAHWSAGDTEGEGEECPVLNEIRAIGGGHRFDCLIIDDARYFLASPPPPHNPAKWPTIIDVFDAIREQRPEHSITVLGDQVIAFSPRAQQVVNDYARKVLPRPPLRQRPGVAMLLGAGSRFRHRHFLPPL